MKSKVLDGFEFVEPIIREVRSNIEFMYKVKLNKDTLQLNGFSSNGISKLCAMHVNNLISSFLLKNGIYMRVQNYLISCEVKHCPSIPSELWHISHFIIKLSDQHRKIYIDPLASVLYQIDPDAPDVYISESFPEYLTPYRNRSYHQSDFFYWLEYKVKGRFYDWIGKRFCHRS